MQRDWLSQYAVWSESRREHCEVVPLRQQRLGQRDTTGWRNPGEALG